MSTEILPIPEERLGETIRVIRAGLKQLSQKLSTHVSRETEVQLRRWCNEEEKYLRQHFAKEFWP
jgi:hypothetical protein